MCQILETHGTTCKYIFVFHPAHLPDIKDMIQKMLQKMKHFVKAFLAKNKVYLNAPCILITRRKIIKKYIYINLF